MIDENRLPPHDKLAEVHLLGGILRDPQVLHQVRGTVRSESFYFDCHQKLFTVFCDLSDANKPIDLVTVHAALNERQQLADFGGPKALADLWESSPTGANAPYHAELVRECAALRAAIHAGTELIRDAYDRADRAEALLATAQDRLAEIAADTAGIGEPRPIRDVLIEVLHQIDDRIASGGGLAGLPTGYPDLDDMLGGLRGGQLVIVGARPSVGKTALGVSIAYKMSRAGHSALLFSLEMPAAEIGARILSMGSEVSMHRFMRGSSLDGGHAELLYRKTDEIGRWPLFVDDASEQTAGRMIQVARQAIRKHKVAAVIVDYLQLVRAENPKENRVQQVGMSARRIKHLARVCRIPVICLCQLNREVENRSDQKPRLSDLRESGEIEQHADVVILLHRPGGQPDHAEVWDVEAIVAKQRNGPTGMIPLKYRRGLMRFETVNRGGYGSPPSSF